MEIVKLNYELPMDWLIQKVQQTLYFGWNPRFLIQFQVSVTLHVWQVISGYYGSLESSAVTRAVLNIATGSAGWRPEICADSEWLRDCAVGGA